MRHDIHSGQDAARIGRQNVSKRIRNLFRVRKGPNNTTTAAANTPRDAFMLRYLVSFRSDLSWELTSRFLMRKSCTDRPMGLERFLVKHCLAEYSQRNAAHACRPSLP